MTPVRISLSKLPWLVFMALPFWACAVSADVVVIVNKDNPLASLSREQVSQIFLGTSITFADGKTAIPVEQTEESSSFMAFHASVTGKSRSRLAAHWSLMVFSNRGVPPRVLANDAEVINFVRGMPGAVGYIQRGSSDASVKIVYP
jgi:ABC-type phosphate transport system substrate-binding protein